MSNTQLVRICATTDVPDASGRSFVIGNRHIAVFNNGGTFYVTSDLCSHEHEHLSDGWLDEDKIECPRHGAQFDLVTGEALSLPAMDPIEVFAAKIENGDVWAEIPLGEDQL